jgi:cysteinyl-tRNA synthetase
LYLTAQYRKPLNFTWDALTSAQNAHKQLIEYAHVYGESEVTHSPKKQYTSVQAFVDALHTDLNTPQALAVLWSTLRNSSVEREEKKALLECADALLGLGILDSAAQTNQSRDIDIPESIQALMHKRQEAKDAKDFIRADSLRNEIEAQGFVLIDTKQGTTLKKVQ